MPQTRPVCSHTLFGGGYSGDATVAGIALASSHSPGQPELSLTEHRLPPGLEAFGNAGDGHSTHLIRLELSGTEYIEGVIDGQSFSGRPRRGQCIIVPAGESHEWTWRGCPHVLRLRVMPCLLQRIAAKITCTDQAAVELKDRILEDDPFLFQLALRMKAVLGSSDTVGKLYAETLVQTLALHLIQKHATLSGARESGPGGLPTARLRRVISYMQTHLEHDVRLDDLAAQAGMSPFHFSRLFKESTGETPVQHLIRLRIEAAQHLLRETSLTIAEVCRQVGYQDQSHFATVFRRRTGQTPRAFRHAPG